MKANSSVNARNWDFNKIDQVIKGSDFVGEDFKKECLYVHFPSDTFLTIIDNRGENLGRFSLDGQSPMIVMREHMLAQDWDKLIKN